MRTLKAILKAIAYALILISISCITASAGEVSQKDIRKRVKELEKDGWKSMDMPLDKQVERTMERRLMTDDEGFDKYIAKTVSAKASSYSAAQMAAENIAKVRIASDIGSSVASLANVALENNEISAAEASTITSVSEKAKVLVSQKLGRVLTTMCVYRMAGSEYEVSITVLYDQKKAIEIANEIVRTELANNPKLAEFINDKKLHEAYKGGNFSEHE